MPLSSCRTKSVIIALGYCIVIAVISYLHVAPSRLKTIKPNRNKNLVANGNELGIHLTQSNNQRYTALGRDINCLQKPLDENTYPNHFEDAKQMKDKKFAYAWYAASQAYLCSALTAMKHLKDIRKDSEVLNNRSKVDYVLTFVEDDLNDAQSLLLLDEWEEEGGVLIEFESLRHYSKNIYYQASYQKFRVFQLLEYSRVIFVDADGIILQNLDHLFLLKFPPKVHLAAPQAYWFRNQGVTKSRHDLACPGVPRTVVTSALLVVEPSQALFDRVQRHFGPNPTRRDAANFDMDVLNKEFSCSNSVLVLPKHYATLDAEYYERDPMHSKFFECQDIGQVQYLHFTAKGKPWSHPKQTATRIYRLSYGREARRIFQQWFRATNEICPWLVEEMPGSDDTEIDLL